MHVTQTHCVDHVVHQLVNFGPLEPGLPTVPHDFGVGSYDIICHNGEYYPLPSVIISQHSSVRLDIIN